MVVLGRISFLRNTQWHGVTQGVKALGALSLLLLYVFIAQCTLTSFLIF